MALRLIAVLFFMLSSHMLVEAQETNSAQPIMGSAAADSDVPMTPAAAVVDGIDILVIGDALGGGLGAGFNRRAEVESGLNITVRFNEESGIARPEVYDWSATLPKILEGKSYDAAAVLLGANDRQVIRADNLRYEFNSPEWIAAYRKQADRIIDALTMAGTKVYWVSIPPMADPEYEAAMAAILKIQKEQAAAKGATFVDIRPAFLSADGRYTDVGPDDTGQVRKLRSRDGVGFFKQGNNRMAQLVLEAIKKGGSAVPATANVQTTDAAPGAEPDTPLFGQTGGDGLDVTFHPLHPGAAVLTSVAASGDAAAGLSALQSLSPPGSAAEKLFVSGEAPPAPPGRADDFSMAK